LKRALIKLNNTTSLESPVDEKGKSFENPHLYSTPTKK
jgi:hypothetical protein